MEREYKTISNPANDFFIEKKSKFIGYAKPVSSLDEATEFISSIKQKHWDATHNVSAFVLKDGFIQRSSDDGEPNGTAGIPVLNVILKENLLNVCVVVTRYFGGVLLGAGGLVRAYSHASKLAVEAGGIITMAPCSKLSLMVDYNYYDKVSILLQDFDAKITDTDFGEKINLSFTIKSELENSLNQQLVELSSGKYFCKNQGTVFAAV